jgi:hypothetical protein
MHHSTTVVVSELNKHVLGQPRDKIDAQVSESVDRSISLVPSENRIPLLFSRAIADKRQAG